MSNGDKTIAKARANSPFYNDGKVNGVKMPAEFNEAFVNFIIDITPEEPLTNLNDVLTMQKRFKNYLEQCCKHNFKMGNQSCYLALGLTADQFKYILHTPNVNRERYEFCLQVKQILSTYREVQIQEGMLNPVIGIFWQKHFDGYTDVPKKDEETITTMNDEIIINKELEQRYIGEGDSEPQDVGG